MAGKNSKKLKTGLFGLCLVFLLFSCASAPKPETFYKGRSGFDQMPEGASFYLLADVQSVRPILDSLVLGGMSGAEIKDFLDMSDVLTLAVFQNSEDRHFYAAAAGKFPNVGGGLFFSTSKDWEKKTSSSGMPYWHSAKSMLSVSINARAAYLSDADPFVRGPGAKIPETLVPMQKDAVLSGWMNNPSQAIKKLVTAFEIPIDIPAERFLYAIYSEEDKNLYTAILRFEMSSNVQAAGLVGIFSLARLGIAFADFSNHKEMETLAKAFFSRNPVQEGNALVLQTGTLSGKDIALLFNTISVY